MSEREKESRKHCSASDERKSSQWLVRVMVIDASSTIREMVETCLRSEGFVVQSFSTGVEAMQRLRQPDVVVPDLIVLNSVLPDVSGYGVVQYIMTKPQFTHTLILMLMHHNGVVDRLKARLAGSKSCLAIPFVSQYLLQVILKMLSSLSATSSGKSTSIRDEMNHESSPPYVVW
ncbi:response regulator [Ktedonospora formicarum]|uniref:Response regulatory domain-containing protein n=1 Tax=Ktedonospora formicarum TaxID=2778364 RepID=A0A8J3I896_9CHLR|nr:response regulator [Ktedonospora formicarum]GHO47209.1 hypothetical protein KSX_53720 [Ktedonospora formicarum]